MEKILKKNYKLHLEIHSNIVICLGKNDGEYSLKKKRLHCLKYYAEKSKKMSSFHRASEVNGIWEMMGS